MRITAITTIATKARMIAYSTSPCPCCEGAKNINIPFKKSLPEYLLSAPFYFTQMRQTESKILDRKKPCLETGLPVARESRLRQGAGDGAEGVADLGSQETHDRNHDDRDESENNRILDETLAFFFRSE